MNISKLTLTVAAALSLASLTALAQNDERPPRPEGGERPQRPDGQRGFGGPRDGDRGPGGPGGFRGPMMMPVMQALDANQDGTIDENEIDGAVIALRKLDKNGDRKLTQEELRPAGFTGGPGGPGGPGFGGPRPEGGMRPEGDRGPGGPGGGELLARLMENDKNGDGKLQKDELPERMQQLMERADSNGDGALDKAELDQMSARMRDRGPGGPRPEGGPRGPRPEGNDNNNAPRRPPVDE